MKEKAKMIEENERKHDYTRIFKMPNGDTVTIALNPYCHTISFEDSSGNALDGEIHLKEETDEIYPDGMKSQYRLTHLYVPKKYIGQGLGEESIKFFTDYGFEPIIASEDDGIKRDDGSHLTGNARSFVESMQLKGLITPYRSESFDDEDY